MIDIKKTKEFSFLNFKNSLFYLHDIDTYNHLYLFLQFFPNLFLSYDRLNKSRFKFDKIRKNVIYILRTILPDAASRWAAWTIARRARSIASAVFISYLKISHSKEHRTKDFHLLITS